MKKRLFLIILIFLLNTGYVFALSKDCKYSQEFNDCTKALKENNSRSIDDFICSKGSSWSSQDVLSQIILDLQFKKVDKKVEKYIVELETNKDEYFGPNAKKTIIEAVDDIENKFGENGLFYNEYIKSCGVGTGSVLQESLDCFGGTINSQDSSKYFNTGICTNLIKLKLDVNKQVAYDVLKLNKQQIDKDQKKLYQQDQRTKFDKLVDILNINISYMDRILKKWTSKTKNAN